MDEYNLPLGISTDLYTAIYSDDFEKFKLLVIENPNAVTHVPIVFAAVKNENSKFLEFLFEKGMDFRISLFNINLIDSAIIYDRPRNLKLILDRGEDVNFISENGMTPLMTACQKGNIECAKILLDKGADIHQMFPNVCKLNSMNFAIKNGRVKIVQLLIDRGYDLEKHQKSVINTLCSEREYYDKIFNILVEKLNKSLLLKKIVKYDRPEYLDKMLPLDLNDKNKIMKWICRYDSLGCAITYIDNNELTIDFLKELFNSGAKETISLLMEEEYKL